MEYRRLGGSGLQVSAIGLGTNTFGTDVDLPKADAVIGAFIDAGCNFIDSADSYPPGGKQGDSEVIIGQALKNGRRNQVLVATKFYSKVGPLPNDVGGSRKHVMDAVEASLRRLDMDTIDLYQMHRPDPNTPIEETLRALDDLVKAGKVRYIGCSGYAGWQLVEALWTSKAQHLNPYVSVQPEYNMLSRSIEKELIPACQKYDIGIIPYWPLAGGFLTGKYKRGVARPDDTRGSKRPGSLDRWTTDANFDVLEALEAFAATRGHTLAELAVAWLLARPQVDTVICGVSRAEQVGLNAKAADWKLTPAEMKELDGILA